MLLQAILAPPLSLGRGTAHRMVEICNIDISVGNGASLYRTGVLYDYYMFVVRLLFVFLTNNKRTTDEQRSKLTLSVFIVPTKKRVCPMGVMNPESWTKNFRGSLHFGAPFVVINSIILPSRIRCCDRQTLCERGYLWRQGLAGHAGRCRENICLSPPIWRRSICLQNHPTAC